jgi:hypothetical protein
LRIAPGADETVVAITADGASLHTWWGPGFVAGPISEPVVRDGSGQVVAQNGEIITKPELHGHPICATADSIYILD